MAAGGFSAVGFQPRQWDMSVGQPQHELRRIGHSSKFCAKSRLGHCSPRLSALSGPSRIGPTDHFEGIRASHIKGQTLVEMAGTHHRSHIMENVTLTPKEQSRLQVLNSLAAEHMTLDQAAELMGVTSRRILAAYREHGAAALAQGHRGRRPVNATPEALVVDVAQLARTRYAGVNHTHLAELLAEREGFTSAGVPRQLYLPVGVNQFCRFTSLAWPRCWAALVR